MPTIVTRGVASARGAGTFSAAPPPPPTPPPPGPTPPPPPPPSTLQTVTFTNSGSWTAPSGVTSITNVYISGGLFVSLPERFVYIEPNVVTASSRPYVEGGQIGPYTYAAAGSYADSVLAQLNSGSPADRIVSYRRLFIYDDTTLPPPAIKYWSQIEDTVTSYRIRGAVSRAFGPWDNRSNEIVFVGGNPGWYVGLEFYVPPETFDGTPSTAFGYSAAGGTAGTPAQELYFSTLSVTPGQIYNIGVGTSNGYVQFQFNQG